MADETKNEEQKPFEQKPQVGQPKQQDPVHNYKVGDTVEVRATIKSISGNNLTLVVGDPDEDKEVSVGTLPHNYVKPSSINNRIGAIPKDRQAVKEVPAKHGGVKIEAA